MYIKKAEKQIFMRCTLDGVNSHGDGGHKTAGMQCYKYLYNTFICCYDSAFILMMSISWNRALILLRFH